MTALGRVGHLQVTCAKTKTIVKYLSASLRRTSASICTTNRMPDSALSNKCIIMLGKCLTNQNSVFCSRHNKSDCLLSLAQFSVFVMIITFLATSLNFRRTHLLRK